MLATALWTLRGAAVGCLGAVAGTLIGWCSLRRSSTDQWVMAMTFGFLGGLEGFNHGSIVGTATACLIMSLVGAFCHFLYLPWLSSRQRPRREPDSNTQAPRSLTPT